jgi:spermidine synthase
VIGDGADFVAGKPGRFDLVIVDGYDGRGRTGQLDTASFYSNAHACMTQGGMLATNLLTRTRGVRSSVARMQGAFDGRVLPLPPSDAGNMVVIAAAGAPIAHSLADLRAAATRLRAASGLSLLSAVERAASVAEAGVLRL